MGFTSNPSGLSELPDEILLEIISYLELSHIANLQLITHRFRTLCLDDKLWKDLCFENSSWYQTLLNRRSAFRPVFTETFHAQPIAGQPDGESGEPGPSSTDTSPLDPRSCNDPWRMSARRRRKLQDRANWDPTFPGECVSWYDEYIHRHATTTVNWLQAPRGRDWGFKTTNEARGLALYNPYDGNDGLGTMLAVSPLGDGSVCLWDVKGTRKQQGSIIATSDPGILLINGPGGQNNQMSEMVDTGVAECVSVDNDSHRAFIAVQSHLIEVDLHRLQVVSRQTFESPIATLSAVNRGVPLTVGTSVGVHLHDFRTRSMATRQVVERLDGPQPDVGNILKGIFDSKPLPEYLSLMQRTPTYILHLPRYGFHDLVSNDIYVSGRFHSILHVDRRKFPSIVESIWSGAHIKSLAALPCSFSTVDTKLRRQAELTPKQLTRLTSENRGTTLIAGGAYGSKGSLEMYGLSSAPVSGNGDASALQNSVTRNRQTAAASTILSVTNHGSKIVFSDASGLIKWFERDGLTECRHIKIGHSDAEESSSLFASSGSDNMARKILSTRSGQAVTDNSPNDDNILLWTGEKLGMVSFTKSPLFTEKNFSEPQSLERAEEKKKQEYSQRMRQALRQQADEVRFIGSLRHGF